MERVQCGNSIRAWLSCFRSPKWSQLPSLLSLSPSSPFSSCLVLLYWRDCSRAWGHHVMPQPEALLGSPGPEGTGPAGLLGVTSEATWPSSPTVSGGIGKAASPDPLLGRTCEPHSCCCSLSQVLRTLPKALCPCLPHTYLSTIKAPTQDVTKEPDVSSRCLSGKQD